MLKMCKSKLAKGITSYLGHESLDIIAACITAVMLVNLFDVIRLMGELTAVITIIINREREIVMLSFCLIKLESIHCTFTLNFSILVYARQSGKLLLCL